MAIECDIPEASGMSTSSAMICTIFAVMDARYVILTHHLQLLKPDAMPCFSHMPVGSNNIQAKASYKEHIRSNEDLYGYLGCCENGQTFPGSGGEGLVGDKGVGTFGGSEDHTAIMSCETGFLNMFSYCPTRFEKKVTP